MAGSNGKVFYMPEVPIVGNAAGATDPSGEAPVPPQPNGAGTVLASMAGTKSNIALDLLPFTGVPFSGSEALWAWGRLLGYSAAAYMLWKPSRTASYVFAGAAAISLATSLSATARK
jgi:hypothetical protein